MTLSKTSKVLAIVVILIVLVLIITAFVGKNVSSTSNQSANIFDSFFSFFFGEEEESNAPVDRCKTERDSCVWGYNNRGDITEAQRSLFIEEICMDSYEQCFFKEEADKNTKEKK